MAKIAISGDDFTISEKYSDVLAKTNEVGEKLSIDDAELTDEDIESISKTINSVDSPSEAMLNAAKEEANNPQHNEQSVANVILNPANGKPVSVEELDDDDFYLQSFEEMLADPNIKPMDIDLSNIKSTKEEINTTLKDYGVDYSKLTDEDYEKLDDCISKFNNKEKYSYYSHLPEEVKRVIDNIVSKDLALASKMGNFLSEGRNYIATEIIRDIVSNTFSNVALIDLEKSIRATKKETMDVIKSDSYWRSTREYFLKTIPAIIDKMIEDGKEDQVQPLRDAGEAFIQSYLYTDMRNAYESGKLKVKKIQIEKFKRTCSDFNFKYQKSQNIITELSTALPVLDRHCAKSYDIDVLQEFVCAFVNYTKNMDPNNKIDHIFMYYFIHNILTLDFYDKSNEEDVAFHNDLLNSINIFLSDIVKRRQSKE